MSETNSEFTYLERADADIRVTKFNGSIYTMITEYPIREIVVDVEKFESTKLLLKLLCENCAHTRSILGLFWEHHHMYAREILNQPEQLNFQYPFFGIQMTREVNPLTSHVITIMKHLLKICNTLLFSTLPECDVHRSAAYLFDHFIKTLEREQYQPEILHSLKHSVRNYFCGGLNMLFGQFVSKSFILKPLLPPLLSRLKESPERALDILAEAGRMVFPEHTQSIGTGMSMAAPILEAMRIQSAQSMEQNPEQTQQQVDE